MPYHLCPSTLKCASLPPPSRYHHHHQSYLLLLQLTFRTFNRDFGLPNHNADDLAPLLRDSLMPARGKMHRDKSAFLKWKTSLFDLPLVGLPGIVNFIDVRTQWFDAAVKGAIRDGITQVGVCV